MSSTAGARRRGDQREVDVRKVLEALGFMVGSRRKIPGPGDLLAVRWTPANAPVGYEVLMLEVKSTTGGPWHSFCATDRQDLVDASSFVAARPVMAWWPPRGPLTWFTPGDGLPSAPWPAWDGPSLTTSTGVAVPVRNPAVGAGMTR